MFNKGKITPEEVASLKEMYSPTGLFKWISGDKRDEVVYKVMDHSLMKFVRGMMAASEAQGAAYPVDDINEKIFDTCVLWPRFTIEEKMNFPVGAMTSLVKCIQEKSGFIDIDVMGRAYGPDIYTTVLKDFDYWADIDSEAYEKLAKATPFRLTKIKIGKWIFLVRPLTRADIQNAAAAIDDTMAIVKSVVMWPEKIDWDVMPVGIIENLGRTANKLSGWDDDSQVVPL
jgi:hypothetical protein